MTRQSLAALISLALAVPAWTQVRAAAEKTSIAIKIQIRDAYAGGVDLTTIDLPALRGRLDSKSSELLDLYEQAKYVQNGREPNDRRDAYVAFIRSVARRLGTRSDKAVELYGDRMRSRTTAVSTQDLAIREALTQDIRQNHDIPEATRKKIARNLVNTSRALLQDISSGGESAGAQSVFAGASPAAKAAVDYNALPPQVQPVPLLTHPAPSPAHPPSSANSALSWSSLAAHLDWDRGKRVAMEAFTGTLAYVAHMGKVCYRFVKQALLDAGTNLLGLRSAAAGMFSEDVRRNPAILKRMGYRRVDLAHIGNDPGVIPDGSILAYAPGCSFADPRFGHMEITVSAPTYLEMIERHPFTKFVAVNSNEVPVCHFNCTKRSMPFLRTWGRDRKVGGSVEKACLQMFVPVKSA